MAIPPSQGARDDRVSLCLEPERAYIDVHAIESQPQRPDHDDVSAPRRQARSPNSCPAIIEETLAARGLGETSLIADWPAIVGESIARYARPIQMQWPPRPARRDPEAPVAPATLVLRVDGAFALEAQHNAAVIVSAGQRASRLALRREGRLPARAAAAARRRSASLAPPGDAAEAAARAAAAPIEDEELREALTRLGAQAIERSARRGPRGAPSRRREIEAWSRPSARRARDPRMNGAGNKILVLDLRGAAVRARRRRRRARSIARPVSTTIR